jgi:hypothetical protein
LVEDLVDSDGLFKVLQQYEKEQKYERENIKSIYEKRVEKLLKKGPKALGLECTPEEAVEEGRMYMMK